MTSPEASPPQPPSPAVEQPSLIEYPCDFPIKVMGANAEAFVPAMVEVARRFDPVFDAARGVQIRESRGGNYLGLTLTVRATSRAQLDGLYQALSAHPLVKYAI
jgi:uncharacterized protein